MMSTGTVLECSMACEPVSKSGGLGSNSVGVLASSAFCVFFAYFSRAPASKKKESQIVYCKPVSGSIYLLLDSFWHEAVGKWKADENAACNKQYSDEYPNQWVSNVIHFQADIIFNLSGRYNLQS